MSIRRQVKGDCCRVSNKQMTFFRNQKVACFLLVFFMLLSIPVQAALVGHWKLDESSGTIAYDSSGNGYTGTLQNMSGTEWSSGEIDGAITLDGSNDYISLPRADVLEDGNSSTHYLTHPFTAIY